MGVFRFRRFSVENTESAMKVNTDGVLLGALMSVRPGDRSMLDVGTGTGTIALMAAQRISDMHCSSVPESVPETVPAISDFGHDAVQCRILAIDIDGPSAREAALNFANSPWPSLLTALHCPLDRLVQFIHPARTGQSSFADTDSSCRCPNSPEENAQPQSLPSEFDHIFSNPPYYDLSLHAPDLRRNAARHTDTLSYRELIDFAAGHLTESGILSVILPADTETWLCRHARMSGLRPFRIVRIRTSSKKRPSRIVAEFSRHPSSSSESLLTIRDGDSYTSEYIDLTREFYLYEI